MKPMFRHVTNFLLVFALAMSVLVPVSIAATVAANASTRNAVEYVEAASFNATPGCITANPYYCALSNPPHTNFAVRNRNAYGQSNLIGLRFIGCYKPQCGMQAYLPSLYFYAHASVWDGYTASSVDISPGWCLQWESFVHDSADGYFFYWQQVGSGIADYRNSGTLALTQYRDYNINPFQC